VTIVLGLGGSVGFVNSTNDGYRVSRCKKKEGYNGIENYVLSQRCASWALGNKERGPKKYIVAFFV
jgi:hypothetical protein